MNKKACFLLAVSLFLLISACSRKDGNSSGDTREVVTLDDLSPEEKAKLFKSSGVLFRENQYLADNLSRIETSHNEQGMKIERYFYKNMPNLKFIEIFSLANGQKQIFIHNENGTVKSLSENSLAWLAKASPDEITGDAPPVATEQQRENTSGGIKINTLPPIVIKSTPLPTPVQPAETKTEANVKTDAPADKKVATSQNKEKEEK